MSYFVGRDFVNQFIPLVPDKYRVYQAQTYTTTKKETTFWLIMSWQVARSSRNVKIAMAKWPWT